MTAFCCSPVVRNQGLARSPYPSPQYCSFDLPKIYIFCNFFDCQVVTWAGRYGLRGSYYLRGGGPLTRTIAGDMPVSILALL